MIHSNLSSRRRFLSNLGAAAGALLAAQGARAVERPGIGGVRLAIATICTDGFGNHHHVPALRTIPELGFENVEFNVWYPDVITPGYLRRLKARCAEAGLRPISLQGSGFGGEGNTGILKDLSHKLQLMRGCEILGCNIVKCTGARRGTEGGIASVIEVCKELAPVAEDKGMLIVLENHANNVLERPEDYDAIFAAVDSPNIGMCLDTGHFEGVGEDLHAVIDRFHEQILHVDLKDCRARGEGHDTVPFGQGVTDFDAFLKHLEEKNYRGYLVVEQAWREPKGDWRTDLKQAYEKFKEYERG